MLYNSYAHIYVYIYFALVGNEKLKKQMQQRKCSLFLRNGWMSSFWNVFLDHDWHDCSLHFVLTSHGTWFGFIVINNINRKSDDNLSQHQDNTRPHTSLKCGELCQSWLNCPNVPTASLDLKSSDFHLFGPMKKDLCGQHFPSNNVVRETLRQ